MSARALENARRPRDFSVLAAALTSFYTDTIRLDLVGMIKVWRSQRKKRE